MELAQQPGAEVALGGIETLTEPKKAEAWMRPVELVAAALLAVMMVTVLANVIFRYVLDHPLLWGDEVASLAFIWMAMLGAAIAVDRHEHLRLTIFLPLIPTRLRGWVEVRKNSDQQVAVEIGERHSVDLLQIEKFSGIGAGLNDTVIGLADDQ